MMLLLLLPLMLMLLLQFLMMLIPMAFLWGPMGFLWAPVGLCDSCLSQPPSSNNFCSGLSQPPNNGKDKGQGIKGKGKDI